MVAKEISEAKIQNLKMANRVVVVESFAGTCFTTWPLTFRDKLRYCFSYMAACYVQTFRVFC